jgi:FKBP-type peptidyl-prolyl cis-trans isomerase (trigger factor)
MAEQAKSRLTQQTLTRTLANAGNINATTTEISDALNSIVQGVLNFQFENAQDVNDAVKKGTITTSTYIIFKKEVQLTSDVLKTL